VSFNDVAIACAGRCRDAGAHCHKSFFEPNGQRLIEVFNAESAPIGTAALVNEYTRCTSDQMISHSLGETLHFRIADHGGDSERT